MMPRMRTIEQASAHIREADPSTAITKTALRRLVISGELPCVRVGQKYLLDLDAVEAYMQTGTASAPVVTGNIRRIDERCSI